jgi:alanine dehydrogenase
MPSAGDGYFVVKIVGVYPGNAERGLPVVRGLLAVIDAATGEVLLLADAGAATGWRTAAATALALELLGASRRGIVLGVIGAGVQARYHLRLLTEILEPSEVLIYSRRTWRARVLAEEFGGLVAGLDSVLRFSDIIVAATTATTPVIRGDVLREGAIVASIGAPKPVREIDPATVLRAGCVLVDTLEGVMEESDEIDMLAEMVELREALHGRQCRWKQIRLYKSVGTALLDHAIGLHLLRRLSF